MSSVLAKDIPMESQFMTDYWNFRKKYYIPESSDSYWEELVNSANSICDKYGRNSYMSSMILLCVDDINKRFMKENTQ